MKRAVIAGVAALLVAPPAAQATPVAIAAREFDAATSFGFAAIPDGVDTDLAVDAGRCRRATRHKWLCPFRLHGSYTAYDDNSDLVTLRAGCHAKAFVTRNAWRFSRRLSGCPDAWLP